MNEIWKEIPGFNKYMVSNLGRVYSKFSERTMVLSEQDTTVGTYLCIQAMSDKEAKKGKKKKFKTVGVHRLVCLAFHGKPPNDGIKYDVNHKDGNKHNNVPENLEWATRSQNITHSYQSGIRNDSRRVIAVDHLTGERIDYYSMAALARAFNLNHLKGGELLHRYHTEKYRDRWTFETNRGDTYITPKRKNKKPFYALDCRTNKTLYTFDDKQQMALMLKLNPEVVGKRLRSGSKQMYNGFIFFYGEDVDNLPIYTEAEVSSSINAHEQHARNYNYEFGVVVKDHRTGSVKEYATKKEAGLVIGINQNMIGERLQDNRNLSPLKGYSFKYPSDERPFPELTQEELELHLQQKTNGIPIKVTDSISNTTKTFANIPVFAKSIGIDPMKIRRSLRQGSGHYQHYHIEKR